MAASEIRDELLRLAVKHGGVLQPAIVVEAARQETSPLHDSFEWDDTEAAAKYRIVQARQLIRVTVSYSPADSEHARVHRVFVSLSSDRQNGGGYRTTVAVMSNDERRQELLNDALADLQTFRAKYATLVELSDVFTAIADVQETLQGPTLHIADAAQI